MKKSIDAVFNFFKGCALIIIDYVRHVIVRIASEVTSETLKKHITNIDIEEKWI